MITAHHLRVIARRLALASCVLVAACTTAPAAVSPSPAVTTSAGAASHAATALARSAQPLIRGDVMTMTADRDMVAFFADGGSLFARSTRDGPAPYSSKIQRAAPSSGSWRTIVESDAAFMQEKIAAGRMALVEYREPPLSGGAHDMTVVVLDLGTGQKRPIDRFALSAATFRGGGGGPRRAAGGLIALGTNNIAWTHANELAGGNVDVELRVAPLGNPSALTVIARSTEWIEPVLVDDTIVVYVLGESERDEVRLRSIATGEDRRLATFASPTPVSGRTSPVRSGSWIGWLETKPAAAPTLAAPSTVTFEALNTATGEVRSMAAGGPSCSPLTANAFAFAWSCRTPMDPPAHLQALDTTQWKLVDVIRPGAFDPLGLEAMGAGFLWTEPEGSARHIHFFTPAHGAFGITGTSATEQPLAPPTYVRWAVDRSKDPARPYILDIFFDGVAAGFSVLDPSGQILFRVPISGSGKFGPETCMARVGPRFGTRDNATWILIDREGLEQFMQHAATYRVQANGIGGPSVILPLVDTGCRAIRSAIDARWAATGPPTRTPLP